MWSPQAQIIIRDFFLPIPNATPELSVTRYARTRSTTCICAHSSSIHQLHPYNKSRLFIYSNSLKWMLKSEFSGREQGFRCYCVVQDNEYVDDGFYIRRCVEVARQAIGHTSPNPMVGCIIVKNGKIVGEGFHPKAGQPHAEVFALRDAGDLAENATAYVSLEPCNHYGRTPPCTEALIKAKVKKVVVGMVDPNPIVASKGVNRLRDAGIDVTVSIEEDICKKLNEAYIHQMLTGKPFLTLRYSLSVNGCLLDQIGEEVEAPGGYYSKLLQEYDAVILSPSSSSKELTIPVSKEKGAKQPLWIILSSPDSLINIPPITDSTTKVIIFTDKAAVIEPKMAHTGIETVVLDRLNVSDILDYCKSQGFCSVLWDLRETFGSLEKLLNEGIEQKLLQKVVVEVLPQWEENQTGDSQTVIKSVAGSLKLKNLQPRMSGQSVILEGYLSYISN